MVPKIQIEQIRIAVTGPESCGKTTLVNSLCEWYDADPIPEFAVKYLERTNGVYEQKDLDLIAIGQKNSIELSQNPLLISDTDFTVLQVWSEYRFGSSSDVIRAFFREVQFDLYLLCAPDIPWVEGPFRENRHDRMELFEVYEAMLRSEGYKYYVLRGTREQREKKSRELIDSL